MVKLTPEQSDALRDAGGNHLAIEDPASQQTYYLVTEHELGLLQEIADEDQALAGFSRASWDNAIKRSQERP